MGGDATDSSKNRAEQSGTLAASLACLATADRLLESPDPEFIEQSRDAALEILRLVDPGEKSMIELAELGLKARRTYVDALGRLLFNGHCAPEERLRLTGQATDAVENGLEVACHWMRGGNHDTLRPLAVRLFHFGAHIYRRVQPQFLAEFVLENVGPTAFFRADPEFVAIAREELGWARRAIDHVRATTGRELGAEDVRFASELEAALRLIGGG